MSKVELEVRFGKTLLPLDCDGLEPMLYPLARRDLAKQGSRCSVVVGDKVVDELKSNTHATSHTPMKHVITPYLSHFSSVKPISHAFFRIESAMSKQRGSFINALGNYRLFDCGQVMDWNEGFRMVVVTRNPELELPPDAAAVVVEVNFSVAQSGLEGQLLGLTLQKEQPELEAQKQALLQQEKGFKVQLAELEASLLAALAGAEGDLLENHVLIESLTATKLLSAQIEVSLAQSGRASAKLDEQREGYRPFARDGSKLYFLVASLTGASNMYRYSLAAFSGLFSATLGDPSLASPSMPERLRLRSPALESTVLHYVGRGRGKLG